MNLKGAVSIRASDSYRTVGRRLSESRLKRHLKPGDKLHLGCGPNRFDGWVNVDMAGNPDLRHDLRWGLPIRPGLVAFIYSEHVFEHLMLKDAVRLFVDCRKALRAGGVMRIAMPSLSHLVESYSGEWRQQAWLEDPEYSHIDTSAHMLNHAMRGWGHRYVYDAQDLTQRLENAGFIDVSTRDWGQSPHTELQGLETRPDSKLILEATSR